MVERPSLVVEYPTYLTMKLLWPSGMDAGLVNLRSWVQFPDRITFHILPLLYVMKAKLSILITLNV